MPFQISPGVNVSEIDLTTIIPAVSTTTGAFAGHLRWGPAGVRVLTDSEDTLVNTFGKPNTNTAVDFFTAANFLSYGNSLYIARVIRDANTGVRATDISMARNAHAGANATNLVIKNEEDYRLNHATPSTGFGGWVAKYPGILGNDLRVSVCASANAYESAVSVGTGTFSVTTNTSSLIITATGANTTGSNAATKLSGARVQANNRVKYILSKLAAGDIAIIGPDYTEVKIGTVPTTPTTTGSGNTTSASASSTATIPLQTKYMGNTVASFSTLTRRWEFYNSVSTAPGTSTDIASRGASGDEVHVVVVDGEGGITGYANTILEIYEGLSKSWGVKSENGTNYYYADYINQSSRWIWWYGHQTGLATYN
jgi:hypothetical protein